MPPKAAWPTACAAVLVCVCKGADARLYLLRPLVLVATSDGDGHDGDVMVVSMRILRCKNVCSGDYARCLSIAIMPRPRERRRAQHHDTDTTADPTRCAAHRLPTAVTASVTGGLVAKLRGRYNRTPLHATISLTMTLITAARRICWRFWQHTGQVMTSPVFTALLSASESPQACHAPTVLVSVRPRV